MLLQGDGGKMALTEIRTILVDSDISPFEVIHSGLVSKLLQFLTSTSNQEKFTRDMHLRIFLNVFLNTPVSIISLVYKEI